jgi:hypothetical protein
MLITLLLHVALAVPPTPAIASAVVHIAVAEAAEVWAPYGVVVDGALPCGPASGDSTIIAVIPVATPRSVVTHGWTGPLGAITFATDGAPAPAITVFLTDIERLVLGAHVLGLSEWQWPATLRDQLIGRALGRVLAHEIGHYLLRSKGHAAEGLMRPQQLYDDLISPSRQRFRLSAAYATPLASGARDSLTPDAKSGTVEDRR